MSLAPLEQAGSTWEPFDLSAASAEYLSEVRRTLPPSWTLIRNHIWFTCRPPEAATLPLHGWKIHVSASRRNAVQILRTVATVTLRHRTSFKFAIDESMLLRMNSDWSRGGAGKFIAIYPSDEGAARILLEELYEALREQKGPYILSDRQYGDCAVLFYRYGSFVSDTRLNWDGERQHCMIGPDGSRVVDRRNAWFEPPQWITEDPFASSDVASDTRRPEILLHDRYRIEYPLKLATKGGVYLAVDLRSGKRVVIKEGRPFVREELDGRDARDSLAQEYRILELISSSRVGPQPVEFFSQWEHVFLVEEFIAGVTFGHHAAARGPYLWGNLPQSLAEVHDLWGALTEHLRTLHSLGVVCGDLSLDNIIAERASTSDVRLIDFESATLLSERESTMLSVRTPGFASPARRMAAYMTPEDDLYSLGATMLAMVFPFNWLIEAFPSKRITVVGQVCRGAGISSELTDTIVALMDPDPTKRPPLDDVIAAVRRGKTAPRARYIRRSQQPSARNASEVARIANDILRSADISRSDRLFPADPHMFRTNPLSVAYGAIGVLRALALTRQEIPPKLLAWVLSRNVTAEDYTSGLYLGSSGIAWALWEMGVKDFAVSLMAQGAKHPLLSDCMDLFYGAAGYGLSNLKFWQETKDQSFLDEAVAMGQRILAVAERTREGHLSWRSPDGQLRIGYGSGGSGIALFLLYLHFATGDQQFLAAGERALAFDLSHAVFRNTKGISFPPQVGTELQPVHPYWMSGSAGVGKVLLRYFATTQRDDADMLLGIMRDCATKYTVLPGMFHGLAGIGNFMLDCAAFTGLPGCVAIASDLADSIMLGAIERDSDRLAFVGASQRQLSADFGTGSAGILTFLSRLADVQASPDFATLDSTLVIDELLPVRRVSLGEPSKRSWIESQAAYA